MGKPNLVFVLYFGFFLSNTTAVKLETMTYLCERGEGYASISGKAVILSFDGYLTRPPSLYRGNGVPMSCNIVFRPIRSGSDQKPVKHKIGVRFRRDFIIARPLYEPEGGDETGDECREDIYLSLSTDNDDGGNQLSAYSFICGSDPPPPFEIRTDAIYLEFYALYLPLFITSAISTTDRGDAESETTTQTTTTPSFTLPEFINGISIADFLPRVFFNIEFTVFEECDEKSPLFVCEQSGRCLENNTLCDEYGASNCVSPKYPNDLSDEVPPSCPDNPDDPTTTTTASTTKKPEEEQDLRVVWVTISILLTGVFLTSCYWIYLLHIWPSMKAHNVPDRLEKFFNELPANFVAFCVAFPGNFVAFWLALPGNLRRAWTSCGIFCGRMGKPQTTEGKDSVDESTNMGDVNSGELDNVKVTETASVVTNDVTVSETDTSTTKTSANSNPNGVTNGVAPWR